MTASIAKPKLKLKHQTFQGMEEWVSKLVSVAPGRMSAGGLIDTTKSLDAHTLRGIGFSCGSPNKKNMDKSKKNKDPAR